MYLVNWHRNSWHRNSTVILSYGQLVEKLAAIGVMDSEPNIRNKLSRGKFTAVFLIQCLEAIGSSSLRLD